MREQTEGIPALPELHPDAAYVVAHLADEGLVLDRWASEPQNSEYGSALLRSGDETVRLRVGKTTPTKVGHFVTVWRRDEEGTSAPFRDDDGVHSLMVVVREGERVGLFRFPTPVLREQGILAGPGSSGKRGFRVYASWVAAASSQARRTQSWQTRHFREIDPR